MQVWIAFDSRTVRQEDIRLFLAAVEQLCMGYSQTLVIHTLNGILNTELRIPNSIIADNYFIKNQLASLIIALYPIIEGQYVKDDYLVWGYTSKGEDTIILLGRLP